MQDRAPSLATLSRWLLFAATALMVLYPVSWLVRGSLWSSRPGADGFLTLAHYARTFGNLDTWGLLVNSLHISGAKSLLACIIGIFLAWLVARTDVPLRGWIEVLAPLPFFIPGLLSAMAWAILANPSNGLLNTLLAAVFGLDKGPLNVYSSGGMAFVMALSSSAFVYLLVLGAMRNMDTGLEESARLSGAGGLQTFFTITLPLLLPALSGAAVLTFISGLESFETPIILGTPGKVFVFTNEIYYHIRWTTPPAYGAAMTLAVLLTILMLLMVLFQWRLLGRNSYTTVTGRGYQPPPIPLGRWSWPALALVALYLLFALVLPIGLIIVTSFFSVFGFFSWQTLTLENYLGVFRDHQFARALVNTIILAVGGGLLTMLLSGLVAYVLVRTRFALRRVLELITWLPWALQGIVLSLAMLWAYIRLPIPIYGTVWVLLLAYVTHGLPLGVRTMSGVLVQVSPELEESARLSGASWQRTFVDVVLALVRPGFVAGWFLLGYLFMRQLSIAVMLYGPGSEVLSMLSLRAWERGVGGQAAAIATIMLLIMVAFLLVEVGIRTRVRRRVELRARGSMAPGSRMALRSSQV